MSTPNDPLSRISLQKPSSSLPNQPPDLPPMDNYGGLLPQLLAEPRACPAGWGLSWLTKAFMMFKDQFLLWLGIGVVYLVILLIGSYIPVINLVFSIITFVFIGGIIKGCQAQATGGELRFDHLFSAFGTHLMPLVILFLLYIVAIIIVMIPVGIVAAILIGVMGSVSDLFSSGTSYALTGGMIIVLLFISLLVMLAIIPLVMAVWFAPALIVIHNISPVDAMKMSFKGSLKNIIPFTVFGIVGPIIMILIAVVTVGLGLLVLLPVGMITYYTSYRDVWTDQPLSAL